MTDGLVQLYKAVPDDYLSREGHRYTPGSVPVATDWTVEDECQHGLLLSPTPALARFWSGQRGIRFLRCPVRLDDLRPPQSTDAFPYTIKARACCGPVVEIHRDGTLFTT